MKTTCLKTMTKSKKMAAWVVILLLLASAVTVVYFLCNRPLKNGEQKFLAVLNNEKFFIDETDNPTYLKSYKPFKESGAVVTQYGCVDFDGDGQDEWVVAATREGNIEGYLLLRMHRNLVYGYTFWPREMQILKADGTFQGSSGAAIQEYSTLSFLNEHEIITERAYADDITDEYRLDGKPATAEAVNAYVDEFNRKPNVQWTPYTANTDDDAFLAATTDGCLRIEVTADENAVVSLTVTDQKTKKPIQEITLDENERFADSELYVADVNFDGEEDLVIPKSRTAYAGYAMAYVWDPDEKLFVRAPTFETIPNVALDVSDKAILSLVSGDKSTSYTIAVFDKGVRDFRVQKRLWYYANDDTMYYGEEALRNGAMHTVAEFAKPIADDDYYTMDPELHSYYCDDPDWLLALRPWKDRVIRTEGMLDAQALYRQFLDGDVTAVDADGVAKTWNEYALHVQNDDWQYAFLDVNGDAFPELCVHTVSCLYVFSIEYDKVWCRHADSYSRLLNDGGFLMERHGDEPPHVNYDYYVLDGNYKRVSILSFSEWESDTVDGVTYPAYYEVNGEEVSQEIYRETTEPYHQLKSDKIEWIR